MAEALVRTVRRCRRSDGADGADGAKVRAVRTVRWTDGAICRAAILRVISCVVMIMAQGM
eukprot:COSAG01_NODE_41355_length_452_cov_1.895184_1_plen_59_part_01